MSGPSHAGPSRLPASTSTNLSTAGSSAPRSTTGTSSPDQLSQPLWASDLHAGATDPNVNTALYAKWNIFIHQNPTKAAAALRAAHRDRTPTKMDMNCIALTWVLISFLAELILSTPKHPISDLRVPRALLASDLADVYVDIITDPTFYREYPVRVLLNVSRSLLMSLKAYVRNIVHAMCAIVHGVGFIDALRDDARADRILDRAPLLWDVLWNNRNFVSAYDRTAFEGSDAMRGLISQVVYYYLKLYQSRKRVPQINATRLAHVALTCWFYVKDTHHDESALNYVLLVSRCTRSYAELDVFAQCAVDAFGPEPFLARFHRALDSPRVLNQELTDCVQALCEFAHHPAVLRLLGPMETCRRVIEAFRRQQRAGDPRWEWRVLSRAANLLQWGTTLFPCQIGLRPLILQHDVVGVMAHAMVLCAREKFDALDAWLQLLTQYTAIAAAAPKAGSTSAGRADDVLAHLHRAVKKVWYPTLHALCELRPPEWKQSTEFTRLCKQWTGLGRALGLSVASEQQAFDAARTGDDGEGAAARRMCAWNVCVYAKRRPLHAMLACAACNKAWYCNRACQARDWKEGRHKETCHGKAAKRS